MTLKRIKCGSNKLQYKKQLELAGKKKKSYIKKKKINNEVRINQI